MKVNKWLIGIIAFVGLFSINGFNHKTIHAMPTIYSQNGIRYWSKARHVRTNYDVTAHRIYRTNWSNGQYSLKNYVTSKTKDIFYNTPLYVGYNYIDQQWNISNHSFNNKKISQKADNGSYNGWYSYGSSSQWKPYYIRHSFKYREWHKINNSLGWLKHDLNNYNNHQSYWNKVAVNDDKRDLNKLVKYYGKRDHTLKKHLNRIIKRYGNTSAKSAYSKKVNNLNNQINDTKSQATIYKDNYNYDRHIVNEGPDSEDWEEFKSTTQGGGSGYDDEMTDSEEDTGIGPDVASKIDLQRYNDANSKVSKLEHNLAILQNANK